MEQTKSPMHGEKVIVPDDVGRSVSCDDGNMEEAYRTQTLTERGIKSRHAQMIAIGMEHQLSKKLLSDR